MQQRRRQHPDVDPVEAGERHGSQLLAAAEDLQDRSADDRGGAGDVGADDRRPVGLLVPRQQVAGEGEAEHDEEQARADQPGDLARVAVGAPHEDPQRVQADEQHQQAGRPVVDPADDRAERRLVDVLDALVGVVRARDVRHRERDAGHDLDHEQEQRGACPACGTSRCCRGWTGQGTPVTSVETPRRSSIQRPMRRTAQAPSWRAPMNSSPFSILGLVADHRAGRRPGLHDAVGAERAAVARADEAPGAVRTRRAGTRGACSAGRDTTASVSLWRTTWTPTGAFSSTQPSTTVPVDLDVLRGRRRRSPRACPRCVQASERRVGATDVDRSRTGTLARQPGAEPNPRTGIASSGRDAAADQRAGRGRRRTDGTARRSAAAGRAVERSRLRRVHFGRGGRRGFARGGSGCGTVTRCLLLKESAGTARGPPLLR